MAYFRRNYEPYSVNRRIKITGTEVVDAYTTYVIELRVGQCKWAVKHRYNDFYELHEKLVVQFKLDKSLLPPKKLFGSQSERFVRKRQAELELYLQTVLQHFTEVPSVFAAFLLFQKYEIHGITHALAEELYEKGDLILEAGETFHVTPLQLHAVTTRLQLPEPTCLSGDTRQDIGHILDFITVLKHLKVEGTKQLVGTSNISMFELNFDLNSFRVLESLDLNICNLSKICGLEHLKKTLKRLSIHHSIHSLKEVLLLEAVAGDWLGCDGEVVVVHAWSALTWADFSHNEISVIDESVKLMPRVERVDFSDNRLEDVDQLQHLSALRRVSLAHNRVSQLNSLHTKLGNIASLDLSHNRLESLQGFSKLYSLESLDLSHNDISQVLEVRHVSCLPCLEKLDLTSNPVTSVLDYRTNILKLFAGRAKELQLDGERTTQKELDTVAVLLAIQKSREVKEKVKRSAGSKKPAHEAPITDESTSHAAAAASRGQHQVSSDRDAAASASRAPAAGNQGRHLPPADIPSDSSSSCSASNSSSSSSSSSSSETSGSDEMPFVDAESQPYCAKEEVSTAQCCYVSAPAFLSGSGGGGGSVDDCFMLSETLPGSNDAAFVTHLTACLPPLTPPTAGQTDGQTGEQRAVHVMWCATRCYANAGREVPACVYVSTHALHVLRVLAGSERGQPRLQHWHCTPLAAVQQLVLGYRKAYVRVEEAFVGPSGTFTFLTASADKTDLFVDVLKMACRRAIAPGSDGVQPHVMQNGETDWVLRHALQPAEGVNSTSQVHVRLYMLVSADMGAGRATTHSLVVTSRNLCVLREDYVLRPAPTFGAPAAGAVGGAPPQFTVLRVHPIGGRIAAIHMYDSDTYCADKMMSVARPFPPPPAAEPHFIGYGVRLTFSDAGPDLDVRVTNSGQRDRFLSALTRARREMSERGGRRASARDDDAPPPSPAAAVDDTWNMTKESDGDGYTLERSEWPTRESPTGESSSTIDEVCTPPLPPATLTVKYPSDELLTHLTDCGRRSGIRQPLPAALQQLAAMPADEFVSYFHSNLAKIGSSDEQLHHVLWTAVTPYTSADSELLTCVVLTNQSVYFVSNGAPPQRHAKIRTHSRNKSDSYHQFVKKSSAKQDFVEHASGIVQRADSDRLVRPYHVLALRDLRRVNVGLFDQRFRLAGGSPDSVFACVTRDHVLTQAFLQRLLGALHRHPLSPSPDVVRSSDPLDFYAVFGRRGAAGGADARCAARRVQFIYPSDDSIDDLSSLVLDGTRGQRGPDAARHLLLYLLLWQWPDRAAGQSPDWAVCQPRTLLVVGLLLCLTREDHVSYPLPDFAVSLPPRPRYQLLDVRCVAALNCVRRTADVLVLVFADDGDGDDFAVDATVDHYSSRGGAVRAEVPAPPDVCWVLGTQTWADGDRLLKLLQRLWGETHDSQTLPVHPCTESPPSQP